MRRGLTIIMLVLCGSVAAQVRIRDLWASVPERLIPELTQNDRLDQIDFVDNNMEARVRTRFDGYSVLDTLTDNYLHCTLTTLTSIEMRLLPTGDSTCVVAVVHTAKAPVAVSTVRFYDTKWVPAEVTLVMPGVEQFVDSCDEQLLRELADLPLVEASLSAESTDMRLTISAAPFSRDTRHALEGKLHPVILHWNEEKSCY